MFNGLGLDNDFLNSGVNIGLGNLDGMNDLIDGMPNKIATDAKEMFKNEMSKMLDFDLWLKVIELQKDFNTKVAPGWEQDTHQQKYDYWVAILDETVEVIGSKHWKWWKDSEKMDVVDWQNVNVELIDLFHFILSIAIQQKMQDTLFMQLASYEKIKAGEVPGNIKIRDPKFFGEFWQQFLMAVWQKSLPLLIVKWAEFFYRSGGDYLTLVRDYFIKNALNHIRQEFGYSSGHYVKMWRDPEDSTKLVEDNDVARILLQDTENLNKNSLKDMQERLRNYYIEYVIV